MPDRILVLNAGSSSLKFSVFDLLDDELKLALKGNLSELSAASHCKISNGNGEIVEEQSWHKALGHNGAIHFLFDWFRQHHGSSHITGIGHRVAHGGIEYTKPLAINAQVVFSLTKLIPLVPLHQPHNLNGINLLAKMFPELTQVACFDTSFHINRPHLDQQVALPRAFTEDGIRRYGFHGLSYEYIASILPSIDSKAARGRTIVLHLGNGSSLCAMQNGQSIATTMGFSSLEGMPMGSRSGSLDPGIILYLMDKHSMNLHQLEGLLYKKSGLLGVSGLSSDMHVLLESKKPEAQEAVDLFCYRANRLIGSLAAALGGVDAIVFTAGIGEHAAVVREKICQMGSWLGIKLDNAANQQNAQCISQKDSQIKVLVLSTNEELMIAQHTKQVLGL